MSAGIFIAIAFEVIAEKEEWLDTAVFNLLHSMTSPVSTRFFELATQLGSGYFLTTVYLIILSLLLWKKRGTDALAIGLTAIGSSLSVALLKVLFARTRPHTPLISELNTYSFPSGHTVSSFVFFGLMAWECSRLRMKRPWKIVLIACCGLLAFIVGTSRVVLRYHYASDVVAGWCVGIMTLSLFILMKRRVAGGSSFSG